MAVPSGTYQTYAAKGRREDLEDVVYDISPMDFPFMSNVSRGTADATYHEWQTDALAAASADNANIEGDDAANNTATATKRYGNYTQLFDKVVQTSSTQRAVNTAGRRDEHSYQKAKRLKELKRDIEARLTSKQAAAAGAAGTARECAGLGAWLFNNQVKLGSGTTTVSVTTVPTTDPTHTNETAVTVAALKSCIQLVWTDGGNPTLIIAGPQDKVVMSGFAGIATQYRDNPQVGPATIIGAADVYVSDFGTHNIVASRFSDTGTVYVLDPDTWEVCYLQPIQEEELAKTGHSDRSMVFAELTLAAHTPEANGKVYATR